MLAQPLISEYESASDVEDSAATSAPTAGDDGEDDFNAEDAFGLARASASSSKNVLGKRTRGQAPGEVQAAPDVINEAHHSQSLIMRPTDTLMNVNVPYADMTMPEYGPQDPFGEKRIKGQNTLAGHVEEQTMSDFDFRSQQRSFDMLGYARNPSTLGGPAAGQDAFIGDVFAAAANNFQNPYEMGGAAAKRAAKARFGDSRESKGSLDVVEGEGAYVGPWAGWKGERVGGGVVVAPEQEEVEEWEKERAAWLERDRAGGQQKSLLAQGAEKSVFHGGSTTDYQGRTYMHIPTDVDVNLHGEPGSSPSFLPKSCIHTFTGHTKGVSTIRLFPKSAHLLLSASMDTRVKLWDIYHEGKCLRTFMGHSKAVKDVTFNNSGDKFLSASYDRQIKLWDTETGQCTNAFSNGKIPHVVKFHPERQDIFLAGMGDKKIIQVDLRSNEITQEYDQHLGPVNTITFVDDNRRFVTTSDDKTIRAWDYDIPVVIKYIAEPHMHSMPAVTLHPSKKWFAAQSLDNQILVWAADSFRQNRKKRFAGHTVAGYACQVGFSPDGRFISSGDGSGNMVFWDWKNSKLIKRLKAHSQVVIAHEWLPHESSKLVTASWDGSIKLWD